MAATPHVLSPNSIPPPPSSHCACIPAKKHSAHLKCVVTFSFLISKNFVSLKLRKWEVSVLEDVVDINLLKSQMCVEIYALPRSK
jgi:hypothetical protein